MTRIHTLRVRFWRFSVTVKVASRPFWIWTTRPGRDSLALNSPYVRVVLMWGRWWFGQPMGLGFAFRHLGRHLAVLETPLCRVAYEHGTSPYTHASEAA